jgi:hypothetical protein
LILRQSRKIKRIETAFASLSFVLAAKPPKRTKEKSSSLLPQAKKAFAA